MREFLNEQLHDEIVSDLRNGDTTVLFEIIEQLTNKVAYSSLSDSGQKIYNDIK